MHVRIIGSSLLVLAPPAGGSGFVLPAERTWQNAMHEVSVNGMHVGIIGSSLLVLAPPAGGSGFVLPAERKDSEGLLAKFSLVVLA